MAASSVADAKAKLPRPSGWVTGDEAYVETTCETAEAAIRHVGANGDQNESRGPDEVMALALSGCADDLLKLDRYERRARSLRRKTFRVL